MVLRASESANFILEKQYLHKSVLIVLDDSPVATVAIVLNRRTSNTVLFQRRSEAEGDGRRRAILFGGEYTSKQGRLFWLHRSETLKAGGVGSPLGAAGELWLCDGEEALKALQAGTATEADFLLVRGFCLWLKVRGGGGGTGLGTDGAGGRWGGAAWERDGSGVERLWMWVEIVRVWVCGPG